MSKITITNLLSLVKEYNPNGAELVKDAYNYADYLHSGQLRESGEPYITHPLNVAYILAEMHADTPTLCAALLHDTLEDTKATRADIVNNFGEEVAILVDGVTKIRRMNFSTKAEQNLANTRKILTSVIKDVRIMIIKLADRLHNMRTLQYKTPVKQRENAIETLEIFVPFAYYLGEYRVKTELEDLAFSYLNPDEYKKISEELMRRGQANADILTDMLLSISDILTAEGIPYEIKVRTKNIYGIYKRLHEVNDWSKIHDLLSLKIMVDQIRNCYVSLGLIHSLYKPVESTFRDYICNPKANMYQSLHTTVFGPNHNLVQNQIRTFDMDRVASFGITTYWDINKGKARYRMQEEVSKKFQMLGSLSEIDKIFEDNEGFVEQVRREILSGTITVFTRKGDRIELPKGSTVIDLAYRLKNSLGNSLAGAKVNDKQVSRGYVLSDGDRVLIESDKLSHPSEGWLKDAHTSCAQKRIRKYLEGLN